MNQIIEECIPADDNTLREQILPENARYQPTEALKKALPNIDRTFFCNFLHQVLVNSSELAPVLLRELNEIWKFFVYFLKMLRHYTSETQ